MNYDTNLKNVSTNISKKYNKNFQSLTNEYKKIYERCIANINYSIKNDSTKTHIFFKIPNNSLITNYDFNFCIKYIRNELFKNNFDTLLLDDNLTLYIDWSRLDEEIEKNVEEKNKIL